jgi:hypothetical protein
MTERTFRLSWPYTVVRAGVARPLLPDAFTFERRSETVPGLLDSGADRSICSTTVARDAGVDVDTLPVRRMRGVGGLGRGRLCPMDIELVGRRIATEVLIGETELILLGRDVFDFFVFAFDQRAGLVLIEPY